MGFGLQSMKDRVEKLNGHLKLNSYNGFSISIKLPNSF